jgi:hypothetical protein
VDGGYQAESKLPDEQPFVSEETVVSEETLCSKRSMCRDYPKGPSNISEHP